MVQGPRLFDGRLFDGLLFDPPLLQGVIRLTASAQDVVLSGDNVSV